MTLHLTPDERADLHIAKAALRAVNGGGQAVHPDVVAVLVNALAREEEAARLLQDQSHVCRCVAEHRPPPLELHQHHVWPLAMGGPDEAWNIEWLCPTTHASAHVVLRHLLRAGRLSRHEVQQRVGERVVAGYAYRVALAGYERFLAMGMP